MPCLSPPRARRRRTRRSRRARRTRTAGARRCRTSPPPYRRRPTTSSHGVVASASSRPATPATPNAKSVAAATARGDASPPATSRTGPTRSRRCRVCRRSSRLRSSSRPGPRGDDESVARIATRPRGRRPTRTAVPTSDRHDRGREGRGAGRPATQSGRVAVNECGAVAVTGAAGSGRSRRRRFSMYALRPSWPSSVM